MALGLILFLGIAFVDEWASKWKIIFSLSLILFWLLLLGCKCDELGELSPLEEYHDRCSIYKSDGQFEIEPHAYSITGNIWIAVE